MKKTLLILSAIVLFFAGCKKDTLFEEGEVLYSGSINGYKYIDLGLPSGLKWATCNVGASSPEDYGDYYAWGETETKSEYTSGNCSTYDVQMNDISGNAQYDVARKKWGGSWRMPTKTEIEELIDNCNWTWTAQGGKKGHKVTGPNGNSIFLPAAGDRVGSSFYNAGEDGFYWSSTPYGSYSNYAYFLHFSSDNQYVGCIDRYKGYTVRPVSGVQLPPTVTTNDITNITSISAICGGNVTFDGGFDITARGVCWSTNPNPTINDNKTSDGSGTGSFTSNLINLTENTTYYVRAYATNEKGTSYGEEKSFKTVEVTSPTVTTNNVTNITTNSAVCGGNVTDDGNGTVAVRGVCWSTSQNPTTDDNKTENGSGTGTYTSNLTNLTENTTYYVRAYATNEKRTSYGEQRSLKTNGTINGHEYVDLGLPSGLKWATCNVGASSPEDYGNYYAWGETETKSEYTESNSLIYGLTISELQSQGYIDGSGNLAPSHDAARANWGSSWRMPTKEEQQELIGNCTWTWTTQNGKNGYKVTGPNGNHIFLPAAGNRFGTSLYSDGNQGYYWSSTPSVFYDDLAYGLFFYNNGYNSNVIVDDGYLYLGQTVRPVSE